MAANQRHGSTHPLPPRDDLLDVQEKRKLRWKTVQENNNAATLPFCRSLLTILGVGCEVLEAEEQLGVRW